jgi:hypothetical protein
MYEPEEVSGAIVPVTELDLGQSRVPPDLSPLPRGRIEIEVEAQGDTKQRIKRFTTMTDLTGLLLSPFSYTLP